jgi:hypothetical protein
VVVIRSAVIREMLKIRSLVCFKPGAPRLFGILAQIMAKINKKRAGWRPRPSLIDKAAIER